MNVNYALEKEKKEKAPGIFALANPFSRGTYRVWQRNRDAFLRLWKTEIWPPFVEAILTLLAFGYGIGVYVQQQVEGMSYLQFIAPGLIMTSILFTSSFDCMFGTYIRMQLEKLFDAIVATPISLEEVVSAEIMWSTTRAAFTGSCVMLVLGVMGLLSSWWVLLVPGVALLTAFMLSSLAIIVTSLVPSINAFNYYITLGVIPMQLFSGVFFPVSQLPGNAIWLVYLSPLYPAVQLTRALFNGQITVELLGYVVWLLTISFVAYTLAIGLMRRRLIK